MITESDYELVLKSMDERHRIERRDFQLRYAESKSPYKVGDVITDHYHTIKITGWKLYMSLGKPELVFTGIQIDNKGKPTKKQDGVMFQSNINKCTHSNTAS